jgi:hypothetical protein
MRDSVADGKSEPTGAKFGKRDRRSLSTDERRFAWINPQRGKSARATRNFLNRSFRD